MSSKPAPSISTKTTPSRCGRGAAKVHRTAGLDRGRADAGFDQVLDLGHELGVIGLEEGLGRRLVRRLDEDRIAGDKVLHDRAENHGTELLPLDVIGLGHRDEVGAKEDAGDRAGIEQSPRQRRTSRRFCIAEAQRDGFKDRAAGEELESRRIGCGGSFDEHSHAPADRLF